jgi:hypothetical protein
MRIQVVGCDSYKTNVLSCIVRSRHGEVFYHHSFALSNVGLTIEGVTKELI